MTKSSPNSNPSLAKAGRYLAFSLGAETYGLPVLNVREIIRLCPITPVATMPPHVRGVINLRGKVIPLIDLRLRFGLPAAEEHDRTCIVVTQVASAAGGTRPYGVIVDGVEEVAHFTAADIEPPPDFGGAVDARFITGMAKAASGVKVLVDLDLISAAESATLELPSADKPSTVS